MANILIVGVGGQGTILLGKIISNGFLEAGYEVKMSEIHGMSQRGGSVSTHIKFGHIIYSPVLEPGTADYLLAFEKAEYLRWKHYLKKDGTAIVNNQVINPIPVLVGDAVYPEEAKTLISSKNLYVVDAHSLAISLGSSKVMNILLLGYLSNLIEPLDWEKIIVNTVKHSMIDLNINAFKLGKSLYK